MRSGTKALAAGVVAAVLWMPASAPAAPVNDHFADRQNLGEVPSATVAGSNAAATKEPGESVSSFAAGHSVWFEWKAPSTGFVTIGACGSDFAAVVGVFTGTAVGSLTKVVSGNASEGPHCPFANEREYTFKATEDTVYTIAVDGNAMAFPGGPPADTEGAIELRIEATPPPVNDDFQDAMALDGTTSEEPGGARRYFADRFGYNWGATKEAGEPDHGSNEGGASVWYSWIAPETGSAQVGVCCGSFYLLGVYVGDSIGSLTEVKSSAFGTIPVVAGTTYRLAVDGKYELVDGAARTGGFDLTASMELSPAGAKPHTIVQPVHSVAPDSAVISTPVDSIAPRTTVDSRRVRSAARSASFGFHASEAGAGFRCRLDAGKATRCGSPKGYAGLSPGQHVFRVYAVDLAGNADPTPATARFAIVPAKREHGRSGGG